MENIELSITSLLFQFGNDISNGLTFSPTIGIDNGVTVEK